MNINEVVRFLKFSKNTKEEKTKEEQELIEKLRNDLYQHFIAFFADYKKKNSDIKNIEELFIFTIKELTDQYIYNDYKININDYFIYHLDKITSTRDWTLRFKNKNNTPVTTLVNEAKSGNLDAKKHLIERYMYLIKINPDMTEDDIQNAYLFLCEIITEYLNGNCVSYISQYLNTYLERSIDKILIKDKIETQKFYDICNAIYEDEFVKINQFDNLIELFEVNDIIENSKLTEEFKQYLYKVAQGYKNSEIAKHYHTTPQNLEQKLHTKKVEKVVKRLKVRGNNYDNKRNS